MYDADGVRPLSEEERIARLEEQVDLLLTALEIESNARELAELRLDELDAVIWRSLPGRASR